MIACVKQLGPFTWRAIAVDRGQCHEAIGSTKWEAMRRAKALANRRAKGELGGCKGEKVR